MIAAVVEESGAHGFLERLDQRGGRPAAERGGVVETETASQHRSHLEEAQRAGLQGPGIRANPPLPVRATEAISA
ncbi:hypothetical protein SBI_00611 [Streptomyces bingchenggensis BCW-1]|uniref:Uncharacterized protein n=1 Tax=Streptomyces bingchenggensis (strain BCW-1) TaxID=749414 RepID=D7C278_STRBB|nr:hypothetical protein SBI_00611 [Streptomyces bingchenggensis BCW-1]